MASPLRREDVAKVAHLARLTLSDEELDVFTEQLSGILEHANDIAALDLTGVVATAHPFDLINVVRDDELRVSLSRDEVLAMAPDAEGGRFAVPRIMGRSAMRRAIDIAADVRAGTTSALGETQVALEAIRARNDELNVFLHIDETGALAAAALVDERVARGEDAGALAGVAIALKDNLCTRGVATTAGSKILEGWQPPYTASVVDDVLRAGAIPVGKTNMDEFAMGSSTETSAYGPTLNPLDPTRVPGGSSGGSAASVAAGMTPLALGSDTGGSIRQPAALCGLVGVKPTYGLVSRYGLIAFASSLDQIGPFATNVADAATLLEAIAGHDPLDSTSLPEPAPSLVAHLEDGVAGKRIGLVRELYEGADDAVVAQVNRAADALRDAGANIVELSIPELRLGLSAYYLVAPAEASSNLARYDGVRYGLRVDGDDVTAMYEATRTAGFGAEVKRRIMLGTYALSAGYYDAYYGQALKVRTLTIDAFRRAYAQVDMLLGATTPSVAFKLGSKSSNPMAMYLSDVFTIPTNLSGEAAISVPFGAGEPTCPSAYSSSGRDGVKPDSSRRRGFSKWRTVEHEPARTLEMVVGLEVHTELKTRSKMFCGCANSFGAEPNTNICPTCLGLPGSLPVLNAKAVELAMAIGLALHSTIGFSTFHRKNYFYPDMPKDFQISQYDLPINKGGYLDLPDGSRVSIERAHLEEDTGKSTHLGSSGRIHGADRSLVDYNRSGVPLVEIVSGPDIRSSAQAHAYASELRGILIATGASDGRMEEGSMRIDANVSVRKAGESFGTRCEIKNLNSLRSLQRAIDYEAQRQVEVLEEGGVIRQETRHWDETSGTTSTMRVKEEAEDYRYFREPDLVDLDPDTAWLDRVREELGVMPAERRSTLRARLAEPTDAQLDAIEVVVDLGLDQLVNTAIDAGAEGGLALARAANELAAGIEHVPSLSADAFAATLLMEQRGELSATQAKVVLGELLAHGGDPSSIAAAKGYEQLSSDSLGATVAELIEANPDEWSRYREGDEKLAQFFIGQVMKLTKGQANGKAVIAELQARR